MIVGISHRFACPESMGLVCASIYILLLILFIPFAFSNPISQQAYIKRSHEGLTIKDFPHHQVGTNTSIIIVG
jgi:UDP-N-acetylglucosamine--dolichyl-phosphate N-acetylglucosaminephosphotransferase